MDVPGTGAWRGCRVRQVGQTRGEHVAGDVQVLLQLIEPVSAEEHLTDDEDTPGIAEHIEGARDRESPTGALSRRPLRS